MFWHRVAVFARTVRMKAIATDEEFAVVFANKVQVATGTGRAVFYVFLAQNGLTLLFAC